MLGIPIDLISLEDTATRIKGNRCSKRKIFLSTPNLNFFFLARENESFYEALVKSNLVVADGIGLILIARILGFNRIQKVSGSDLFEILSSSECEDRLKVFLFGGEEDVASIAAKKLNRESKGIECSGYIYPGFGSADELSKDSYIEEINASNAELLMVSLGAQKGQSWILKNLNKLSTPTISHLGAVINFSADRVQRAPKLWQKAGIEWLWRIKEEPRLFSRYFNDGIALMRLVMFELLPYRFFRQKQQRFQQKESFLQLHAGVSFTNTDDLRDCTNVKVAGFLGKPNIEIIRKKFIGLASKKRVNLELSEVTGLDEYGTGQLLLLKKYLSRNLTLSCPSQLIVDVLRYERLASHIINQHKIDA